MANISAITVDIRLRKFAKSFVIALALLHIPAKFWPMTCLFELKVA